MPGPGDVERSATERLLATAERLAQLGSWEEDLRTGATTWSPGMHRILGLEPGDEGRTHEEVVAFVHPEDRARAAAFLTAISEAPETVPEDGRRIDLRMIRADGRVREIRAHGVVERDERGRPLRWIGTAQDVTDQRLGERELQAHYALTQALSEWETFEEGVVDLLRRLGTALDHRAAALWLWDGGQQALTCRAFWSAPGVELREFEEATRGLVFRPGQGHPSWAWETSEPIAVMDLATAPGIRRRDVALAAGLRSALAVPAVGPDGPVAVLTFYSSDLREPGERLTRTLTGLGHVLGRFLAGRRAELGPRPLTDREIEVLRLAAEGLTAPEIAMRLVLAPSTVKTHLHNIYEKLGVGDRAAAVAHALRTGLIQ